MDGMWLDGYRIERTKQGREYERIGETEDLEFTIASPTPGDRWFYRVTAFNPRGAGRARMVYFYRRPNRLRPRGLLQPRLLQAVPVIPGMRVQICELVLPR